MGVTISAGIWRGFPSRELVLSGGEHEIGTG